MADESKKPRNIKDLKARLGRTIAPGTQPAGAPIAPPAAGVPGPAVPAPAIGGPAPIAPAAKSVPPPVVGPGLGVPGIPGTDVAPPPFMQKKKEPEKPKRPADPFAAGQAAGPQEVRLVIDEKPMADAETGRKGRGVVIIVAAACIAIGLAIGYGGGQMVQSNQLYNATVRDGKDIYETVNTASSTVTKANTLVNNLVNKARGGAGRTAAVDYQTIEALIALEKPFDAGAFARKNYKAFNPAIVDSLFEYYQLVQNLWDKFERLGATSLPPARRQELDRAAAAAGEMATRQIGLVPFQLGDNVAGGLVIVDMPPRENDAPLPEKLQVRTRPGGQPAERTRYTGQPLTENPENYVMLVDTARSIGVLGQQASAFAEYTRDITSIKMDMDKAMEVQGRLTTELGGIARLEEQFACSVGGSPRPLAALPGLILLGLAFVRSRRRR